MAREAPAWVNVLPPRWRNEIDAEVARALTGEFIGTMLFVFLATTGSGSALAVGISYTVAAYAVAALSGGHLNPVVSAAFALSGHQHAALSGLYIVAQILGSIAAALVQIVLLPGVHLGHNHVIAPGCLPSHGFLHHTGCGSQKFSALTPLAAGLAIYTAMEAGGAYTGAVLNPARLIGPAIVFLCGWKRFWFYIFGELVAAFAASAFAAGNFGTGPAYAENRDELYDRAGGHLTDSLMPESNA